MTGKDILQEEFEKAGMRGYKAEQVDEFLQKVAAFVDEQQVELNDLTYKIKILVEKIEEYKSEEGNIRDALLGAQKLGTSIMNEAKTKSEAMLLETRTACDDMLNQTKAKAEAGSRELLQKATSELNELKRESERERITFEKMKKEVSSFKASILKQYKTHLDLLTSLPSVTNPQSLQHEEQQVPTTVAAAAAATREETRQPVVSTEDRVKDTAKEESAEQKSAFFDQDVSNDIIEITRKKNAEVVIETQTVKPQTFTSEILANEKELEEEEVAQTKEFLNEPSENTDSGLIDAIRGDVNVSSEALDNEENALDDGQQEFKINMGTQHKRPNYMEKFGKLEFGGFGNDK